MTTKTVDPANIVGAFPVCKDCGQPTIMRDAWAVWSLASRDWTLGSVFDQLWCETCEGETQITWKIDKDFRQKRIRRLNDALRRGEVERGSIVVTQGVQAKGQGFLEQAVKMVAEYTAFSEDNDPHGEHDFGAFEIDGDKLFWKIDPYDLDMQCLSPDVANPCVTHRVLTIMLACEY